MAGHSKWANIKHRKAAQDKKRGNLFTKLTREVIVAAKMGQPDPDFNPRLRAAIIAAKKESVPKDRIENAIKRASNPAEGEDYQEVRYEGYGPNGVAVIIDCLTDNRNRTASEVRATLGKAGGNLGENGSVAFMFNRVGMLIYPVSIADADTMFEAAVEAGAENVESDEEIHEITCEPDNFNEVRDALATKFGDAEAGRLSWKPSNIHPVDNDGADKILRLVDTLEECDDVQYVTTNADFPEDFQG